MDRGPRIESWCPPPCDIFAMKGLPVGPEAVRPPRAAGRGCCGFFIFIFFIFIFIKIYFCFRNLQEYTPAAPLPGGRGFSVKSFTENLRPGPWRTGRPAAGRPAPQAARQRGGRLPLRYIRVWLPPHTSFASLKIQKKEREEGEREAKPCRIFEPATAGK